MSVVESLGAALPNLCEHIGVNAVATRALEVAVAISQNASALEDLDEDGAQLLSDLSEKLEATLSESETLADIFDVGIIAQSLGSVIDAGVHLSAWSKVRDSLGCEDLSDLAASFEERMRELQAEEADGDQLIGSVLAFYMAAVDEAINAADANALAEWTLGFGNFAEADTSIGEVIGSLYENEHFSSMFIISLMDTLFVFIRQDLNEVGDLRDEDSGVMWDRVAAYIEDATF